MNRQNKPSSLFIVCPFCQIENLIKSKFGTDVFFMTTPAGVLNLNNEQLMELKRFFGRQSIKNIYLVNDISCNFLVDTILQKSEFGLQCEKVLRELYHQNSFHTKLSTQRRCELLARYNLSKQILSLNKNEKLNLQDEFIDLKTYTLVTDKKLQKIKTCRKTYE